MRRLFRNTRTPLVEVIARHKMARSTRLGLERKAATTRSIFVYLRACMARWIETRALKRLAVTCPQGPGAAKVKSLYLMALVIADQASPNTACLEKAIDTLRPYRTILDEHLRRSKGAVPTA